MCQAAEVGGTRRDARDQLAGLSSHSLRECQGCWHSAAVELTLTSKQRSTLRGMAHRLEPVVQVGRPGVSAQVIRAVDAALLTHELIKIRLHEPDDKKAAAHALAAQTGAALCGLVGHTVILFRPHPEQPRIKF